MKASKKNLKKFAKEESETSKTYKRYGWKKQACEEHEHSEFFKKQLIKKKKRPVKRKSMLQKIFSY